MILALIACGIAASCWVYWGRRRATQELMWTTVRGTITVSGVEFIWEFYRPEIRYSYRIQGIDYVGTRVRRRQVVYNFKGPAKKLCEKYPVGASVIVHVDPCDPSNSVLEPAVSSSGTQVLVLLVVGALLLIWCFAT